MHTYLIEMLACPACHGKLAWHIADRTRDRIETGEARCTACNATYPIRDGIGVFLMPERQHEGMWDEESRLIRYVREHPEIERQLLEAPLDALNPADQLFRAQVLEERGAFAEAKTAAGQAQEGLYTSASRACQIRSFQQVIEQLSSDEGPIIDLASGRCYLVEELLHRLSRPVVATDLDLSVLMRDRRYLEYWGLYDRASLLAFDARRTPFKDGAISTLTTFVGLPSVQEPGDLLQELRRTVSGQFVAITLFFSPEDEVHAPMIRDAGLEALLFRDAALDAFAAAGWQVELIEACAARAAPTPGGVLLKGFQVDGLPLAETVEELCVLVAH
jgi:uncharacterized protein YbaR (Trm112 family)